MDWSHQSVLVTGAGGFIGSHLAEELVRLGARTRALVRYNSSGLWGWLDSSPLKDEIEVMQGDVRDLESVRRAINGVDVIFHLAALIGIPYSYQAPRSYVHANVEGTLNVLQAALDADGKRVIHTSTSEVYGTARQVPISEDHVLQAQSPYSASKIAADKMAEAFHLSFGLPVTIVRPFNTYGPRQSARAVIPTIISQALQGVALRLGNLQPRRDFNYVADIVRGFILATDSPPSVGEVVNIGSGREISIRDLVSLIGSLLGKDIEIAPDQERVRPEDSEVERLCADNRKARRLLGWQPSHTLEEGLARTIEWVRENINRYRLGAYAV
jgi:dTDP-glucose 4,6-dehydratase